MMKDACIVTDGSAQFPRPNFAGLDLLSIVPFSYPVDVPASVHKSPGRRPAEGFNTRKAVDLPRLAPENCEPFIAAPDVETLQAAFQQLSRQYQTIFGIFLSDKICPVYSQAVEAAESFRGKVNIHIIDSMTTSVGLGLIVQKVCEAVHAGLSTDAIHRRIRNLIPRLYTLLCTPGLSYLQHNGFLDQTQAILSEMLGIIPIFTLEDGILTPIEKVNNLRQAMLYYQEFLEEFEEIEHIGFLQSVKPNYNDTKLFFEYAASMFPRASVSKNQTNLPISLLFGPHSNCLFILEDSLR